MRRLFYLLLCFTFLNAQGQNVHLLGIMPTISGTLPLSKKLDFNLYTFCVTNTFKASVGGVEYPAQGRLLLIQPSLVYKFNPKWSVAASYAYLSPNPFTPKHGNIFCPWQQVTYSSTLGGGKMWHRLREEELIIQQDRSKYWPISTRLRYQIGYSMPLKGNTLEPREFYLNAYHESFFNTSGSYIKPFSENWNYIGIGYVMPNKAKIELGYMGMSKMRNKQLDLMAYQSIQVSYLFNFSMDSLLNWFYN